jgi:hypothetical protein
MRYQRRQAGISKWPEKDIMEAFLILDLRFLIAKMLSGALGRRHKARLEYFAERCSALLWLARIWRLPVSEKRRQAAAVQVAGARCLAPRESTQVVDISPKMANMRVVSGLIFRRLEIKHAFLDPFIAFRGLIFRRLHRNDPLFLIGKWERKKCNSPKGLEMRFRKS